MEPYKTIQYKGYDINIFPDNDSQTPDDWGNEDMFLVYDHRDFTVERSGFDPTDIFETMQEKKKLFDGYFYFPVYAYIHSGVSLSLGRNGWPFSCPWDTSFKGFALVRREKGTFTRDKAYKMAECLVSSWNDYLSGNVWGFDIQDAEENSIDSCWGYYGDETDEDSYMVSECKSAIDSHIRSERKAHFAKVKTWIKNKVPFYVREPLDKNMAY